MSQMIETACEAALEKLTKLNKKGEYETLVADLNWVLASYRNDGNPEGLYQKASESLEVFLTLKKANARAVAKKLIDTLEKALAEKA